jgi:hypothetical protein
MNQEALSLGIREMEYRMADRCRKSCALRANTEEEEEEYSQRYVLKEFLSMVARIG